MPTETPYTDESLCELLWANGIAFTRADHPPVFTCDEANRLVPAELVGVQTKNLFLRDGKGKRHWLLVTTCEKAVDLKALAPRIGADHLSLGSPERLMKYLGLTPGAVTLFGVANDPTHDVNLVVDRDVWEEDAWRCHPMVNTATLVINREGVDRFLALTGHKASLVQVPERVA